jgi:pimeloyl-ACP methyl ester carboxylesterase
VGDADVLTPLAESRAMFRAIPGASLHVFGRCGHLPAMERPRQTAALLRGWLAED